MAKHQSNDSLTESDKTQGLKERTKKQFGQYSGDVSVSLLAPKTDREDKLGHPPTRFDLDMATSPRIIPRLER